MDEFITVLTLSWRLKIIFAIIIAAQIILLSIGEYIIPNATNGPLMPLILLIQANFGWISTFVLIWLLIITIEVYSKEKARFWGE